MRWSVVGVGVDGVVMMYVVQRHLDEHLLFVVVAAVAVGPQLVKSYCLRANGRRLQRQRRVHADGRLYSTSLPATAAASEDGKQARKQNAKLFLEVVVEPPVEERVTT